jgi:serine/threonine protein kinase
MDRLGESLEDIYMRLGNPFSLKTVLMLVEQTLTQLQFVHSRNIVHRDVKPDNFLIGLGDRASIVHIIDFGLSHYYKKPRTGAHIGLGRHTSFIGTARYASRNAMKGIEQSRRDDLESLGYVWLYLLRGSLPWQGIPARTQDEKMAKILEVKLATTFESLCAGFPAEFVRYFEIVTGLAFDEEPKYHEIRKMFRELFLREGNVYDSQFDWCDHQVRPPVRVNVRAIEPPSRPLRTIIPPPKVRKKRQGPTVALPRLGGSRRPKAHLC